MPKKVEKTVERQCATCGKPIQVRARVLRYGEAKGKPWGQFCAHCAQIFRTMGKRNPNWIHGAGATYRKERIRKHRREAIKRRDKWKCQCCGVSGVEIDPENGKPLDCHHILPVSKGGPDTDWNLCSLCRRCHSRIDRGRLPDEIAVFTWPPPGADWAIGTPGWKTPYVLTAGATTN